MKVKDLIAALQKANPEVEIAIHQPDRAEKEEPQTSPALKLLDELHRELEDITNQGEPFYDDLYNRVGVIIAVLKDGYDPDTLREL